MLLWWFGLDLRNVRAFLFICTAFDTLFTVWWETLRIFGMRSLFLDCVRVCMVNIFLCFFFLNQVDKKKTTTTKVMVSFLFASVETVRCVSLRVD